MRPPSYDSALEQAGIELATARQATASGNDGRARVCSRRAVGAFIQEIAPALGLDAGTNAMANLRFLQENPALPDGIRDAAGRLLGGPRSIPAGEPCSSDPVADAETIIRFYIDSAP